MWYIRLSHQMDLTFLGSTQYGTPNKLVVEVGKAFVVVAAAKNHKVKPLSFLVLKLCN